MGKKIKVKCPNPNCKKGYEYGWGEFGELGTHKCLICKGKRYVKAEKV